MLTFLRAADHLHDLVSVSGGGAGGDEGDHGGAAAGGDRRRRGRHRGGGRLAGEVNRRSTVQFASQRS